MPVWQEFYTQNQDVEIIAIAIDFQGAAKVRPFVEQAQATYTNVVDSQNQLGLMFGFKAVPNGVFVAETGIICYTKFGGFDIRKAEHRQVVETFAISTDPTSLAQQTEVANGFESEVALAHFQVGLNLYQQGKTAAALAEWHKGVTLEPDNWIIRKQIWAIENPERFYGGDVDFDWQREQIASK